MSNFDLGEKMDNDVINAFSEIRKKFTQREIDILSFIISGRSSKRIAIVLSISSRTVDNHMRNIMMKLGCNSREQIIQFVENAGVFSTLKNRFFNLNLDDTLKKSLNDIKIIRKGDIHTCMLVYFKNNEEHKFIIENINEYFLLAGIQSQITCICSQDLIMLEKISEVNSKVFIIDNDTNIDILIEENKKLFSSCFFIYFEKDYTYKDSAHSNIKFLHFDVNSFGSSIFNLLNHMLEDIHLNKIINEFNKISSVKELSDHRPFSENKLLNSQISFVPFKSKNKLRLFVSSTIGIIVILFSVFKDNFLISGSDNINLRTQSNIKPFLNHTLLERPHIILRLRNILREASKLRIVALIGIGGSGKTTIARHYADTGKYSFSWEINAESPEGFLKSFEELGNSIFLDENNKKFSTEDDKNKWCSLKKIKNQKLKEEKITTFIFNKLKTIKDWLLVYDNVEKIKDLQKYLPPNIGDWKDGNIIITTTDNNIKNCESINDFILLEKLSQEEIWQLFNQIVYHKPSNNLSVKEQKKLKEFLNTIPSFPLDVSTAAYYMKITSTPFEKYSQYLENFHKDLSNFQKNILKDASDYTKTRYSIITLSFKKVFGENEAFPHLLLLISLLDSQKIPKSLLDSYKSGIVTDSFIYHLKKYSLITEDTSDQLTPTFSIHRNTQKICFEYIQNELKIAQNDVHVLSILTFLESYIFKAIKNEDFSTMKVLINHCETFLKHSKLYNDALTSSITGMLGCIYYYLGNYVKAKSLLEESLFSLENMNPSSPSRVALISMYLGNVYRSLEDYSKAKDMLRHSLEVSQKNTSDPDGLVRGDVLARELGYLGRVYRELNEFKKAKNLLEQSLSIYEKDFPNHVGHAWILAYLGSTYMIFGEYDKAKLLLEKSLLIYQTFPEGSIGASWVMGYLGNTYCALKEYDKAEELLEKSLFICKKELGDQHAYTGTAFRYLGMLHIDLKNYSKARELIEKSIEVYLENHDENHIQIAESLYYKGKIYIHENNLSKAEYFINDSLALFKKHKNLKSYLALETLADMCEKKAKDISNTSNQVYWTKRRKELLKESFYMIMNYFPDDSPNLIRLRQKIKN